MGVFYGLNNLTVQEMLVSWANDALDHNSGFSKGLVPYKLQPEQQKRLIPVGEGRALSIHGCIRNLLSIISKTTINYQLARDGMS